MSFGSQGNPYEVPSYSQNVPTAAPLKAPGPFMAIAIIAIIFGVIGLGQGCLGGVFIAFQGAISGFFEEFAKKAAESDPDAAANMQGLKEVMALQSKYMVPMVVVLVLSLITSLALFVGGIAGVRKAVSSVVMLQGAMVLSILNNIVGAAWGIYFNRISADVQMQALRDGGAPAEQLQAMEVGQQVGSVVGIVFGIGFAAAIIAMYLVALIYLIRSQKLKAFMAARAGQA